MHCLLVGNYGVSNIGDEALREYMLTSFPEVQWQVISTNPQESELPRLPSGLRSFLSFNWLRTIKTLRHADSLVFGGGTLFTDIESVHACFLWWIHAAVARWYNVPVLFCFQGIGPFRTRVGEWFSRQALKKGVFLSVRDEASATRAHFLVPNTKIVQTFDPVFSLFSREKRENSAQKLLVAIPRHNSQENFQSIIREESDKGGYSSIVILSFQPDDLNEKKVVESLRSSLQCTVIEARSLEDITRVLRQAAMVITERFHGAIPSIAMGIPTRLCPQAPGDKIDQLQSYIDEPEKKEEALELVKRGKSALLEALQRTIRK